MTGQILTIWAKEMVDTLRDRRTVLMMVVVPALLMPVLVVAPHWFLGSQVKEREEATLEVAVEGAQYARELILFLRKAGTLVLLPPTDIEAALREKDIAVALVIPPDFQQSLEREEPASLAIFSDDSSLISQVAAGRLYALLAGYRQQLVSERLVGREIDPAIITPLDIQRQNVATEQEEAATFTGFILPVFVLLYAFLGGMYTAIDLTAGEKERGTLESMLITPARRIEIVIGKWLAVFATAVPAILLLVAGVWAAFQLVPDDLFGGEIVLRFALSSAAGIALIAIPVAGMMGALQLAICIFARNFKEAQNYLTPLMFVVIIPAMAIGYLPDLIPSLWMYIVPVLGQALVILEVLEGKPEAAHLVLTIGSATVYAALCLGLAIHIFTREQVIFRQV